MNKEELTELTEKIGTGKATDKEILRYNAWYNQFKLGSIWSIDDPRLDKEKEIYLFSRINTKIKKGKSKRLWLRVAASVLVALGLGSYLFHKADTHDKTGHSVLKKQKIVPGKNKATLILASGKTILLSEAENGIVMAESKISYYNGSTIADAGDMQEKFTIKTPRGGQYQVTLSDGTKVWLNAASSLTYSASLDNGKGRYVQLEGEGYFEVARQFYKPGKGNAKPAPLPFVVQSRDQEVEVLGTHFNICAYENENSVNTTLLEGSVKVTKTQNSSVLLKPGEQAVNTAATIKTQQVEPQNYVAWKDGGFIFFDEDLGSIMRKISRWYNVEVTCPPNLARLKFSGSISRNRDIGEVLRIIERTHLIHFNFKERRITVIAN